LATFRYGREIVLTTSAVNTPGSSA